MNDDLLKLLDRAPEPLCQSAAARIRELESQAEDWKKIICQKDDLIRELDI